MINASHFQHPWTYSFRAVSALVYVFDFCATFGALIAGGHHNRPRIAFNVLAGLACLLMASVVSHYPLPVVEYLERSGDVLLFTFRGRFLMDLFIALVLLTMTTTGGYVLGSVTLAMIIGIRCVAIKEPDLFMEVFRSPNAVEYDDENDHGDNGVVDENGRMNSSGNYELERDPVSPGEPERPSADV